MESDFRFSQGDCAKATAAPDRAAANWIRNVEVLMGGAPSYEGIPVAALPLRGWGLGGGGLVTGHGNVWDGGNIENLSELCRPSGFPCSGDGQDREIL